MTETQVQTTEDPELQSEMEDVVVATREDGIVEGTVVDVREVGQRVDRIEVVARLPTQKEVTERMRKPQQNTADYKFVRLCQQNGASIDTYDDLLVDDTVPLRHIGDEWEFHAPREKTIRDRALDTFDRMRDVPGRFHTGNLDGFGEVAFLVCTFPLTILFGLMGAVDRDSTVRDEICHAAIGGLAAAIWIGGLLVLFALVAA